MSALPLLTLNSGFGLGQERSSAVLEVTSSTSGRIRMFYSCRKMFIKHKIILQDSGQRLGGLHDF